jgi:hypothetical protein
MANLLPCMSEGAQRKPEPCYAPCRCNTERFNFSHWSTACHFVGAILVDVKSQAPWFAHSIFDLGKAGLAKMVEEYH